MRQRIRARSSMMAASTCRTRAAKDPPPPPRSRGGDGRFTHAELCGACCSPLSRRPAALSFPSRTAIPTAHAQPDRHRSGALTPQRTPRAPQRADGVWIARAPLRLRHLRSCRVRQCLNIEATSVPTRQRPATRLRLGLTRSALTTMRLAQLLAWVGRLMDRTDRMVMFQESSAGYLPVRRCAAQAKVRSGLRSGSGTRPSAWPLQGLPRRPRSGPPAWPQPSEALSAEQAQTNADAG